VSFTVRRGGTAPLVQPGTAIRRAFWIHRIDIDTVHDPARLGGSEAAPFRRRDRGPRGATSGASAALDQDDGKGMATSNASPDVDDATRGCANV
jgi:hypothetical protein